MPDTTFIYALKELVPGEYFSRKIRYIGKANDPYQRFERHLNTKEKCHRGNWIRSLPARGLSLQLEILDEVPEAEWQFWETEYIRVFRAIGFNLVNETDGGDGASVGNKFNLGRKHSPETVEKLRSRKHSTDAREKIRMAILGRKHSSEAKEKMRQAQRCKKYATNTSGICGVHWSKASSRWVAQIQVPPGRRVFLGRFSNLDDAVVARKIAEEKYYGRH
jgi:GIY-YIG catalytic domain-containing protein